MATIKVILYSKENSKRIVFRDATEVLASEIEQTYYHNCDVEQFLSGGARILVNERTRKALLALEKKYEIETKFHIRKLYAFISKSQDGESFYFFNEKKATLFERRAAICCLQLERNGKSFCPSLYNNVFSYHSYMDSQFECLSYGHDGLEEWIGEEDKDNRVCRFCGKTVRESVSFNNRAHAIQEALGNKILFCYEECDTCNHELASVENHFRIMMDFRRSVFRIPRKGKTQAVKVVGKDFIILPNNEGEPNMYIMQEALQNLDTAKPFMHHFELKEPIINEQMYKALCKMVIDMLPTKELQHMENTIKWIKSQDFVPDVLPSIWLTVLPIAGVAYRQPTIDIFINNKINRQKAPYCTTIIWIYDIAYLFIMPLVDVDAGQYKYDKQLEIHISKMKKWIGTSYWQRQDTTDFRCSTPWVDWTVEPSSSNVHILPSDNEVFNECRSQKEEDTDRVSMPNVKTSHISLAKINKVWFKPCYNGFISNNDLMDVTEHTTAPSFIIDVGNKQVRVTMESTANDTTDKILFFKYGFDIVFQIDHFSDYIQVESSSTNQSFAFHFQLRDLLLYYTLIYAEHEMKDMRKGTQFENCSMHKTIQKLDRLADTSTYYVPIGEQKFLIIPDSKIHRIGYYD